MFRDRNLTMNNSPLGREPEQSPRDYRPESLREDAMKIENLANYDAQECLESSPGSPAQGVGSDCIVIKIPRPEIMAQWNVNADENRELNRIIRDLRWTDMITDALIVLAISAVIYFSPSVETMRAVMARTTIPLANASKVH